MTKHAHGEVRTGIRCDRAATRASSGFVLLLIAFVLTALLLAAALFGTRGANAQSTSQYPDLQIFAVKHNNAERTFGLYVPPSYVKGRPAPLLVALHGRFSSAKALHAISRLQAVADARGALLLYPEAAGAFWDDGGHGVLPRNEPPANDLAFIADVIATISADYSVDRDRLFLLGYDSGGAMAMRLVCQSPTRFAAAAVVSALMWQFTAGACAGAKQPTSLLIVHGRDSEFFPVAGIAAAAPVNSARLSASSTIDFWRNANGCPASPSATGGDGSVLFQNCAAGTIVAYAGIPNGTQDWSHVGGSYRLNRHGVDTAALVDNFFFDRTRFALPSGGGNSEKTRDYLLYVSPRYDAKVPTPVIVMLHGRPSNAAAMAKISNMNAVAARHGFIVVYPEGLNNEWNAQFDLYNKSQGSVRTGGLEPAGLRQDDVGFLKTLVTDLGVDLNIDRQRMYVAGFSNGGFMTLRMACSASDFFAGFAEVGSSLYPVMTEFCARGKPAPMLFMHGTLDPSIPIGGVRVRDMQGMPTPVTLSVRETVALFARRNKCATSGVTTTFAETGKSPGTKVMRYVPNNCLPNAPVVFYIIEGGGHTWPGVSGVMDEKTFGRTNMDFEASDKIWEFLSAQKLTG